MFIYIVYTWEGVPNWLLLHGKCSDVVTAIYLDIGCLKG